MHIVNLSLSGSQLCDGLLQVPQCHTDLKGYHPFSTTWTGPLYMNTYTVACSFRSSKITAQRLFICTMIAHTPKSSDRPRRLPTTTFSVRFYGVDILRALIQMYRSDTSLTEPLEKYLKNFYVSRIHEACSAADCDLMESLMNHDPPLGTLYDRTWKDRSALLCAAGALGEVGSLTVEAKVGESLVFARQKVRKDRDRIEVFI